MVCTVLGGWFAREGERWVMQELGRVQVGGEEGEGGRIPPLKLRLGGGGGGERGDEQGMTFVG